MYKEASIRINRYKTFYVRNTLVLETYIIGFKNEGESIIFFIRVDGGISFSGLIDCYKIKRDEIVKDILNKNKVQSLDFICWTHPDLDHSKGIKEIIENYSSEKTSVWIPEGIDQQEIRCSKEIQSFFGYLKDSIKSNNGLKVYSASDKKDLLCYNPIAFQFNTEIYPLQLISYTPNSSLIREQLYLDRFVKNDRSIFLVLSLGEVKNLFTGDIEDKAICSLPHEFEGDHIHVVKIPHHGSGSSVSFLDLGWGDCDLACSTVYRIGQSNLPEIDIMDRYKQMSRYLVCTGKTTSQSEKYKYGFVEVKTDVLNCTYSYKTFGNACLWG